MQRWRYTVYDRTQNKWLKEFQRPLRSCDAAVTRWTRHPEKAMRFPRTKTARGVARWIEADNRGQCVVLNARGIAVQEGG